MFKNEVIDHLIPIAPYKFYLVDLHPVMIFDHGCVNKIIFFRLFG